ncbi:hypothetical protein HA402_004233 [Bradysia odoriphaga]|nr:hypothetical protein HA402_004233 [Bradysia odoriphaga]
MGEYVAGRLLDLGLTPDKIVGVGHSVGCHILDSITTAFENRGLGKIHVVWGMCPATDGYVGWPEMKGLNPGSADTVVHVYTDNKGPFIPRGSINYFINPGCELQPGCNSYECNHIACLTVMGLAFHPASIANQEAFIGDKCFQDLDGCFTSDETSKLAPSSVAQKGCFCPNVDNKPPYYKKPSQPICSAK